MSYDRYEREYHLTPTGWKLGNFSFYGKVDEPVDAPADRVLTMVKEVEQSSGYSPEDVSWREEWRSADVSRTEVNHLLWQFGEYPTYTE